MFTSIVSWFFVTAERAKEIIEMNKRGEKPVSLEHDEGKKKVEKPHVDLAGGDISRFDKAKKKKKKKNKNNRPNDKKEAKDAE